MAQVESTQGVSLHVGDVGVSINLTIQNRDDGTALDLSDFFDGDGDDAAVLRLRKPDQTTADKTLTAVVAASGTCRYVLQSGDLDVAGQWSMQPIFTAVVEGKVYHGDVIPFQVLANLAEPA